MSLFSMVFPVAHRRLLPLPILLCGMLGLTGCDRSAFNGSDRSFEQAEQKRAAQDYRAAVSLYEKALASTTKAADAHFRIGMIYDANLNDAVGAVHHFKRYIEIQPNGTHANEARDNLRRIELKLSTSLADGTFITHADAVKLRQENKDLKEQLAQRNTPPGPGASPNGVATGKLAAREAERHPAPGTRTYQVQPGDSLASISRKFYKTKTRAKDIQDANMNAVPDERKLKPGVTLIIPN